MKNNKPKTCHLPIADYDMKVKLYIHDESGDSVNLGSFFELVYDSDNTKEENRSGLDLNLQRAISNFEMGTTAP